MTRRRLLQAGSGALAAGGLTGLAAARPDDVVEVNVGYRAPGGRRAADRAATDVVREFNSDALTIRVEKRAVRGLRNRGDVRYVEENGTMHAVAQTLPWGVDRVDADIVHDDGETGGDATDGDAGADIAIIDTGIDDDHPDLEANVGAGEAFVDCRGGNCNHPWSDDTDHGTHCAGVADAVDNTEGVVGVSTAATLHAVKVLDHRGSGSFSDVAAGIEYVADQGWDVGSLSLGGSKSNMVEDAVEYADGEGVLLVAAAGNDGPCTDCVGYPAAEPEVVAVSATSEDDSLASFSSTGPEVELAAPGENIYSTVVGGYDTLSGTSMACPHVAGAGGQLMDNGYTSAEARDRLDSTAEEIGLSDEEQGNGLLDVEAAVGSAELRVDGLSASEVETGDGDAEFDVSWEVSDPDGNLDSVGLVLRDTADGEDEDSTTSSVSGDAASDTTRLVAAGDEGSSHSYEVTATVTDGDGNTASDTTTASETENQPTVDSLSLTEVETDDGDAEFDADWSVSDDDGDLDTLELTLYQLDGDGSRVETEDAASPSADGASASGTSRLVAAGDDGSGNTYEVEATVSDTDGTTNAATAQTGENEPAPTVDGLSATEVETDDADAEFDVSWAVSDDDGSDGGDDDDSNLDSVDLALYDADAGSEDDAVPIDVSGGSASDTTRLVAVGDDGSEHTYDVECVVTDQNGKTDAATVTVTETEDTSTAPTASIDGVSENDAPHPHAEFDVSWSASDDDGNLSTAELTLSDDTDGGVDDSVSVDVDGESASGTNTLKAKHDDGSGNDYTVELVVSDADGNTSSDAASFSES